MIELQYECKIKSVQVDGTGEFKPLANTLEKEGILYR